MILRSVRAADTLFILYSFLFIICGGAHNFHGRYEYCCKESMERITELLIMLAAPEEE